MGQTTTPFPADDPADEFAQTRPPDDLFDDDFTPLDQPLATEPTEQTRPEPITETSSQTVSAAASSTPRGHTTPRGPRRGGLISHRPPATTPRTQDNASESTPPSGDANVSTQPRPERREAAVRGDRSGTGGIKRE